VCCTCLLLFRVFDEDSEIDSDGIPQPGADYSLKVPNENVNGLLDGEGKVLPFLNYPRPPSSSHLVWYPLSCPSRASGFPRVSTSQTCSLLESVCDTISLHQLFLLQRMGPYAFV
jgi:hypothetical protein